ncbi:MAG: DUF262 domain-containing protein [Mycoplasmoidaceae bacterium]
MARLEAKNLYDLIDKVEEFEIPIYQRNYDWKEKEIISFLDDIISNYQRWKNMDFEKDQAKYYIGNIIVYDYERKDVETLMVVDGQQRLTSTIIIFSVIRKIIKEIIEKKDTTDELRDICNEIINDKIRSIIYKSYSNEPKVKQIRNRDLLSQIVDWKATSRETIENEKKWKEANLYKNFKSVEKYINNVFNDCYSDEEKIKYFKDILIKSFNHTCVGKITVRPKKDEPSKIFQTINTSGKKLEESDLIKSYIFFFPTYEVEEYAEIYLKSVESKISKISLYKNLSDWYRHIDAIMDKKHHLNKKGLDVYNGFKRIINNENSNSNIFDRTFNFENIDDVKYIVSKLCLFANVAYKVFELISSKTSTIKAIYNEIIKDSWGTFYPLIHNLVIKYFEENAEEFSSKCINEKKVIDEIHNVAKLILHLSLLDKPEKNLTRKPAALYSEYKNEENNFKDFWDWLKKQNHEKQIFAIKKEELKKYLKRNKIYSKNKKRAKYLLIALESNVTNSERPLDYLLEFELEHIYPQNPSDETKKEYSIYFDNDKTKADEFYFDILDSLGNLTLVNSETNNELKNYPWSKKRTILKDQCTIKMNQKLVQYDKWDEKSYNERVNWMVENLVEFLAI